MALPCGTTGSLSPTFVPARLVGLAVKLPSAFTLKRMISNHSEGTFERLRYLRRRPPQSNCLSDNVPEPGTGPGLEYSYSQSGIPPAPPRKLALTFPRLPPILYKLHKYSISNYSKAPRGLSVQSRVMRIFTHSIISPGLSLRQCPSRCTFRAGRNLPD